MDGCAKCADMLAGCGGAREQMHHSRRRSRRTVFIFDAMAAALLPEVLAEQLAGLRIQNANEESVPLHVHALADVARRQQRQDIWTKPW